MSKARGLVVIAACAALLAGCGGGGGDGQAQRPSPSPAEAAGCRAALATIGTIAGEMETKTADDTHQFTQLLDRLQALQGRAHKACTKTVVSPLDEGLDKFSSASAGYTACQFGLCNDQKIARDVVSGGELVRKAVTASNRTS